MVRDSWSLYLDEISRTPLLTREQVVAAARRRERGERAQARLDRRRGLDPETAAALAEAVADGHRATHLLVTSNLRLVVSVARRYRSSSLPLPDLVQEGAFGLIRAVEKFDHRRGFTFSTYATWWIRQAISRAVAEHGRAVRLPKHVSDEVAACVRVRDELGDRLGHEPSVRAVADVLGADEARVGVLLRAAAPATSLLDLTEDSVPRDPAAGGPVVAIERGAELAEVRLRLGAALGDLPDPHRTVLRDRVGWVDGRPRSIRTVAATHGLSRDVVRRVEDEAREMLRGLPVLHGLRDWLEA